MGAGKCTACRQMKPIIEELQKEYAGRLQVDSIDVVDQRDEAAQFNWKLIPCQVFLDADGKELWRHEGLMSKANILAKWNELGFKFTDSKRPSSTQPTASNNIQLEDSPVASDQTSQPSDHDVVDLGNEGTGHAKVIAYYFHRTQRCPTCLTIEEYAKQSIEEGFKDELADGLIEYKPVNIEKPGNEHFEEDYNLTAQALVLVRLQDGKAADWRNLPKVWEVVEDYGAFTQYVESEVTRFVADGKSASSPESSNAQ